MIIANNVMAHVPELASFVAGMEHLLADDGVVTVENPSVWDLIERTAFDTIYHEHFMYYSCLSVDRLVRQHGLHLNHVEYFADLHGGTNRWWFGKNDEPSDHLGSRLEAERAAGLGEFDFYRTFGSRVTELTTTLRELVTDLTSQGKSVVLPMAQRPKGRRC